MERPISDPWVVPTVVTGVSEISWNLSCGREFATMLSSICQIYRILQNACQTSTQLTKITKLEFTVTKVNINPFQTEAL